jgi:hypothetical protein
MTVVGYTSREGNVIRERKGGTRRRDTIGAERQDSEHEIKQSKAFKVERRGQKKTGSEKISVDFSLEYLLQRDTLYTAIISVEI